MPDIKWIATDTRNFTDPTAWEGGIVPKQTDVAIFDGSATGTCTVDINLTGENAIGGLKIYQEYGDNFNSRTRTIECHGPLWLLCTEITKPKFNPTYFYIHGNDTIIQGSPGLQDGYYYFMTSGDLRQGMESHCPSFFDIEQDCTVTYRSSRHPELPDLPIHNGMWIYGNPTVSHIDINNRGILDLTEGGLSTSNLAPGSKKTIISSGIFRNRSETTQTINLLTHIRQVRIDHIEGPFNMIAGCGPAASLSGDLRNLVSLSVSQYNTSGTTLTIGDNTTLPTTTITADKVNGTVTAGSNVRLYGDLTNLANTYEWDLSQCPLGLAGTADQKLSLSSTQTLPISAYKLSGKTTLAGGNFNLAADSTFGISIPPTFNSTFNQNGKKITVPSNMPLHILCSAASPATLNGDIEFNGNSWKLFNVNISNTTSHHSINSECEYWHSPISASQRARTFDVNEQALLHTNTGVDLEYGVNFNSVFILGGVIQNYRGRLDFSGVRQTCLLLTTTVNFYNTCYIVGNPGWAIRWYSPSGNTTVMAESGVSTVNSYNVQMETQGTSVVSLTGDFRPFVLRNMASGKFRLTGGRVDILSWQPQSGVTSTAGFTQDAGTECNVYGSMTPSFACTWPDKITMRGTADQNVDASLAANALPLGASFQKPSGNVATSLGTRLNVVDDSTVPGIANGGTITVKDSILRTQLFTANTGSSFTADVNSRFITNKLTRQTLSDNFTLSDMVYFGNDTDTLDLSSNTASFVSVGLDRPKPGQSLTIVSNTDTCVYGVQNGTLKLEGSGNYTICTDQPYYFKTVDTSALTGTWDPSGGNPILLPEKLYLDDPLVNMVIEDCNSVDLLHINGNITLRNSSVDHNGVYSTAATGTKLIIEGSSFYDQDSDFYAIVNKTGSGEFLIDAGTVRDAGKDILYGSRMTGGSQAQDVLVNYTPANYTPKSSSVEGHLQGLDTAITGSIDAYSRTESDDRFVHKTGNETIDGVKIFNGRIETPGITNSGGDYRYGISTSGLNIAYGDDNNPDSRDTAYTLYGIKTLKGSGDPPSPGQFKMFIDGADIYGTSTTAGSDDTKASKLVLTEPNADGTRFIASDGTFKVVQAGGDIQVANTWYVNGASTSSAQNGSITSPYKTIQAAIDAAAFGDIVVIAAGQYSESLVINDKQNLSVTTDSTIGQYRVVVTGSLTISGTSQRIAVKGLQLDSTYTCNTTAGNIYFDNVAVEGKATLSGGGYHQYDYCEFMGGVDQIGTLFASYRTSTCEDNSVFSLNNSGSTMHLRDVTNVTLHRQNGNVIVDGSTNFITAGTLDPVYAIISENTAGTMIFNNGTTRLASGVLAPINLKGTTVYALGKFEFEPSTSQLLGTRVDGGLHSLQIYDHLSRTGYTTNAPNLDKHLDGISTALTTLDQRVSDLGTIVTIKGQVDTVGDLPATGNTEGDLYFVGTGSNVSEYIWTSGSVWVLIGTTTNVDLTNMVTTDTVQTITGEKTFQDVDVIVADTATPNDALHINRDSVGWGSGTVLTPTGLELIGDGFIGSAGQKFQLLGQSVYGSATTVGNVPDNAAKVVITAKTPVAGEYIKSDGTFGTPSGASGDFVTLDTNQTITGTKTIQDTELVVTNTVTNPQLTLRLTNSRLFIGDTYLSAAQLGFVTSGDISSNGKLSIFATEVHGSATTSTSPTNASKLVLTARSPVAGEYIKSDGTFGTPAGGATPANMVTTDGNGQDITGSKNFKNTVTIITGSSTLALTADSFSRSASTAYNIINTFGVYGSGTTAGTNSTNASKIVIGPKTTTNGQQLAPIFDTNANITSWATIAAPTNALTTNTSQTGITGGKSMISGTWKYQNEEDGPWASANLNGFVISDGVSTITYDIYGVTKNYGNYKIDVSSGGVYGTATTAGSVMTNASRIVIGPKTAVQNKQYVATFNSDLTIKSWDVLPVLKTIKTTLSVSDWTGNSYTVPATNVDTTKDIDFGLPGITTRANKNAYVASDLVLETANATSFFITCTTTPTVDIDVVIRYYEG